MAKNGNVVAGKDCEGCKYFKFEYKGKIVVCKLKNKRYYYGQYVPCEDKTI